MNILSRLKKLEMPSNNDEFCACLNSELAQLIEQIYTGETPKEGDFLTNSGSPENVCGKCRKKYKNSLRGVCQDLQTIYGEQ
jgi:hypothetical protein